MTAGADTQEGAALRLAAELEARGLGGAEIAFVLGSGLGALAELLSEPVSVAFAELDLLPQARVQGHAGRIVAGTLGGVRVLVQQGRVHLYEGRSPGEVARCVRAFAALGCRALVLTNAAGGLREAWSPGALMRIEDHVNLQGRAVLEPGEVGRGSPYDRALGLALEAGARDADVALVAGVYAGLLGPSYETPAEVRMLRWLGADAVGMSTVAEAAAGAAAGLRVAGLSLITNPAAGITERKLAHAEVVQAGREASGRLARLLAAAVPHMAAALGEDG